MNKIYEVNGTLHKGFVGQIAYTICLDKPYQEMDVAFSFDKQRYDVITDDLKQSFVAACADRYDEECATDAQITGHLRGMKTELQLIVTMNDTFIGGVHRQETSRHLYFSPDQATAGCIPQSSLDGVIKVTIVAFSVISDHTHYTLSLSVH